MMELEFMTIRLKPEIGALSGREVQRESYGSADEFVEEAVRQLHDQEEWMAGHRAEIEASIEDGYAAAKRGELLSPDQLHAQLKQKKRAWRDRLRPA